MMNQAEPEQLDVYISCHETDLGWVEKWLLPALDKAGMSYLTSDMPIAPGAPKLSNAEYAIRYANKTIAIISPKWLQDQWRQLDSMIARSADPDASRRQLLPVQIEPVELPEYLDQISIISIDSTQPSRQRKKIKKLISTLEHEIPYAMPVGHSIWVDTDRWMIWLRRNRRRFYRLLGVVLAVMLVLAMLFQLYPFQEREGWQRLRSEAFDVNMGLGKKVGDTLYFTSRNDHLGCHDVYNSGIWQASSDNLDTLTPLPLPELAVNKTGPGCISAYVTDILQSPDQRFLFMATDQAGLLRRDATTQVWDKVAPATLPVSIASILFLKSSGVIVVNSNDGGLFYSADNGEQWTRINNIKAASPGAADMTFAAIATSADTLYAATRILPGQWPDANSGVYAFGFSEGTSKASGVLKPIAQKVIGANEQYSFYNIKISADESQLLVATEDHNVTTGNAAFLLQTYLTQRSGRGVTLHKSNDRFTDIYWDNTYWHTVDALGVVNKGRRDQAGKAKTNLTINTCFPFCIAPVFMQTEPEQVPWLLTDKYVYKPGRVTWYRYLWP